MKRILNILIMVSVLTACADQEGEWFDIPFVRIATNTGQSNTVVLSNVRNTNAYMVYLSATPLADSLMVDFEVIAGDGLVEDVDYKVVTKTRTLKFFPGIYDMPVRIRWMPHKVDPEKDNRLIIRLVGNSKNYTLGFPGPDRIQHEVVIEKRNQ
jgi:hypothetical protein